MNKAHALLPREWQNFFIEFRRHLPTNPLQQDTVADTQRTEAFFSEFRRHHTWFVRSGGTINVWDIAGVGKKEVRNCAVLGWLLDCYGSHGQGSTFLRCFLDSVRTTPQNNTVCLTRLPQTAHIHTPYRLILENSYSQGCLEECTTKSRVDIVIESEAFLLFVEVKIHAEETGDQLKRYNNILRSRACGKPCCMVFLTPTGRAPREESAESIACLSWKYLADSFENLINAQAVSDATAPSSPPLWVPLIQQFCKHIRTF